MTNTWIKFDDAKPQVGQRVWVLLQDYVGAQVRVGRWGEEQDSNSGDIVERLVSVEEFRRRPDATHWQPIVEPSPPASA